jgi:hypothetical protein
MCPASVWSCVEVCCQLSGRCLGHAGLWPGHAGLCPGHAGLCPGHDFFQMSCIHKLCISLLQNHDK